MHKPDQPLHFGLTPDEERFAVLSKLEIVDLLQALKSQGTLMTMSCNGGNDFIMTTVVDLYPELGKLVIECSREERLNRRMLEAETVMITTVLDQIRMQFRVRAAELMFYDSQLVFSLDIPERIVRLQRRDYFRVTVPGSVPVYCMLPANETAAGRPVRTRIVCISGGGIGLHWAVSDAPPEGGQILHGAKMLLPDAGEVEVSLEVRHCSPVRHVHATEIPRVRVGCRYLDLSPRHSTIVQRYINRIELMYRT